MKTKAVLPTILAFIVAVMLVAVPAMAQWGRWAEREYLASQAMRGAAPMAPYGYPRPAYPSYPPGGYGGPGPMYPPAGYASPGYPAASNPSATYQQPQAYPQQGQSPQQTAGDFSACQTWAHEQTGYNPNAVAAGAAGAPGSQEGGGLLAGGARGAAAGAVGGAIGGDPGKGAEIGAAMGGLMGLLRRREERQRQEEQAQAASQAAIQQGAAYNRALDACMTTRGYTVR
jgi:Glycine-zipper domain